MGNKDLGKKLAAIVGAVAVTTVAVGAAETPAKNDSGKIVLYKGSQVTQATGLNAFFHWSHSSHSSHASHSSSTFRW